MKTSEKVITLVFYAKDNTLKPQRTFMPEVIFSTTFFGVTLLGLGRVRIAAKNVLKVYQHAVIIRNFLFNVFLCQHQCVGSSDSSSYLGCHSVLSLVFLLMPAIFVSFFHRSQKILKETLP